MDFLLLILVGIGIWKLLSLMATGSVLNQIKKAGFNTDDLKFWLEGKRTDKELLNIIIQKLINKK